MTVAQAPIRRIFAGVRSLADRSDLELEVLEVGKPRECSQYGDTDREVRIAIGDRLPVPESPGRKARLDGTVVLHRTVGGFADWRWSDGIVRVQASGSNEISEMSISEILGQSWEESSEREIHHELVQALLCLANRIPSELAAQALEGRL